MKARINCIPITRGEMLFCKREAASQVIDLKTTPPQCESAPINSSYGLEKGSGQTSA